MISNTVTAIAPTNDAAFIYEASIPSNRSFYIASDKIATVLRTGGRSADFHEVTGPKKYRVSHSVGNRYTGPENDFHTDDQSEATAHADIFVGKTLS